MVRPDRPRTGAPHPGGRLGRDQARRAADGAREPGGRDVLPGQGLRRLRPGAAHAGHRQHPDPHQAALRPLGDEEPAARRGLLRQPQGLREPHLGDARPGGVQGLEARADPAAGARRVQRQGGAAGAADQQPGRHAGRLHDRADRGVPGARHRLALQRPPRRAPGLGDRPARQLRGALGGALAAAGRGLRALRAGAHAAGHRLGDPACGGPEGDRRQEPARRLRRPEQAAADEGRDGGRESRRAAGCGGRRRRDGARADDARDVRERVRRGGGAGAAAPTAPCPSCGHPAAADARFCASCGGQLVVFQKCARCSEDIAPGARFCARCGTPSGAKPQERKCAKCGLENLPSSVFCNQCGEKLAEPRP